MLLGAREDNPAAALQLPKRARTLPKTLSPGTYSYFCRVHPFMRGAFRVKRR